MGSTRHPTGHAYPSSYRQTARFLGRTVKLAFPLLLLGLAGCQSTPDTAATPAATAETETASPATSSPTTSDEVTTPADDLGEITVANSAVASFGYLPYTFGIELGVWEKRGLSVNPLDVQGGGQVAQVMASGDADIGVSAAANMVAPIVSAGMEAKMVAGPVLPMSPMVMVVPVDSEIEDWEDLNGATVGITGPGSLTDYLTTQLARDNGWEMGVDLHKAAVGGLGEQLASLEAGATDAFVWSTEAGYVLELEEEGRVLGHFGEVVRNNVSYALIARDDVIENRPEAVQAYVDGWFEVVQYMRDNREETIEFVAESFDIPQEAAELTYDGGIDTLSLDGVVPQENLEGVSQAAVETGVVEEAPAASDFYSDQFVPANAS